MMDNDVSTAATMQALNEERLKLRCEVEAYQSLYDKACVQVAELRAEVCAIGTRASMDREEIDSMAKRNDELRAALDAARAREDAFRADVVRLTAQLDASRQACNDTDLELARAMSRAEVLAAEVRAWRTFDDKHECHPTTEYQRQTSINAHDAACQAAQHTDSTHALDPAKFEVKP
jgi:chromosome segregation ATPase